MRNPKAALSLPSWLYLVTWLFFLYLFVCILTFSVTHQNSSVLSALYFVEYGVHEMSHIVTAFLPSIFVAAAGSAGEFCLTVLVVIAGLRTRAYFFAIFGGLWMMLALRSIGLYMADSQKMELPLMGLGDNVKHDWNYVFGQLGWLDNSAIIGNSVIGLGTAVGLASLVLGSLLIVQKIQGKFTTENIIH